MKENWTYKKLGDCFPYIKNGANIKQDKNADGYPITRIETLSGGIFNRDRLGYANIYELDKYSEYILSSHDLLMSHINSKVYIGRTVEYIAKEDEKIIHGMNLLRLKCNPQVIYSSFFVYYTHSHDYTSAIAKIRKDAVNQSSFSITDLKKILIPVPPIETQSRIVSELDLLQSIIDKQKAQLKELDNLAQAVFYDMFGDPKRKGFTMKPLGSIAEMKSGYTPSEEELFRFGSYPYFKVGDMNTEGNQKYLSITKSYANPPKKVFPKDSIVFPKNGAAIGTNKKRILAQESIVDLNTAILICDKNQVVINYIYCWLLSIDFKDYTRRGAVPTLDSKELMNTQLPLPPLSLQQSFSAKIDSIEKQKAAINQSIAETQRLFDYTMDKYFG